MVDPSPILLARFWSKVSVGEKCDCWLWKGAIGANGYGSFKVAKGRTSPPHRVAWELFNGEPLGSRFACHTCDNPKCVNPHHIYAGDVKTNARDRRERGRAVVRDQTGSNNGASKLTEAQVVEIVALIGKGHSNTAIARRFPVSHAMISRIRKGKSWAHIPRQSAGA